MPTQYCTRCSLDTLYICSDTVLLNICLRLLVFLPGTNQCPDGSKCRKWTEVFPTPKSMCEQIWSNSYMYTHYTKGSGRCMQLWFTGPNPNRVVAEYYNDAQRSESLAVMTLLFLAVTSFSVAMH